MNIIGKVYDKGVKPGPLILTGAHELTIDSITDGMVAVCYPDGYVKHHQVESVDSLVDRVIGVLKHRYNAGELHITKLPERLEPNAVIGVKI